MSSSEHQPHFFDPEAMLASIQVEHLLQEASSPDNKYLPTSLSVDACQSISKILNDKIHRWEKFTKSDQSENILGVLCTRFNNTTELEGRPEVVVELNRVDISIVTGILKSHQMNEKIFNSIVELNESFADAGGNVAESYFTLIYERK